MATKVDSVLSENSAKMPMYTYIGLAGVVLSLVTSLMSGSTVRGFLLVLANLASGISMYYIYDSLKKGMANLEQPCTSLCQFCGYGALAQAGLMSLAYLVAMFSSSLSGTGILGTLGLLVGFVYFVLYIVLGCKIMSNYEGKLKLLGILFVAIPAILIVSSIVGFGSAGLGGASSMLIVVAIINAACTAYQYMVAHEVITGKGLF